jgi:hypothetical protein
MPRHGRIKDLTGKRFNRLTVMKLAPREKWIQTREQSAIWECHSIGNLELRLNNNHPSGQSVQDDLIPYWISQLKIYRPGVLRGV